jgi:Uma2 family endonuclease
MVESGAFTEDDRIELIEGWVVEKIAKGPGHEYTTGQLVALLENRVQSGWHVRNQSPITLAESEPEPDISIVRGGRGDYRGRHPGAEDVALVVEVSDTTLAIDRRKASTYAAAAIAEYWIVDLTSRAVEVFRRPDATARAYAEQLTFAEHEQIKAIIGGSSVELAVQDLMP